MSINDKSNNGTRHPDYWYEDDCELSEYHSGGAEWQIRTITDSQRFEAEKEWAKIKKRIPTQT
jgi:hypothetical protein